METVLILISLVLTAASVVLGAKWILAKDKLKQLKVVFKEGKDVLDAVIDMLDDDSVTPEEIALVKVQVAEFKAALNALLGK